MFFEFGKTKRNSKHNKKLIVDDKEIIDQTHILKCIRAFYEKKKKKKKEKNRKQKTVAEIKLF